MKTLENEKKQHWDGEKGEELFELGGMVRKASTKVLGRKTWPFLA